MTTLHFNTAAGRDTAAAMVTARNNIEGDLNNLRTRVSSLVGSEWQGQAAIQFQNEFDTWATQLLTYIETLTNLQTRLDGEIQNWEAVASKF
jgi:WXG100 family type VII secretion target